MADLNITIPPEALEAAARALCKADGRVPDAVVGPDGMRGFLAWENYKPKARAACLAMLRAWPEAKVQYHTVPPSSAIILPLQQEKPAPSYPQDLETSRIDNPKG